MKAAFACWQDRIAPVFDVARQARLIDVTPGARAADTLVELPAGAAQRAAYLAGLGVTTLVCGAVSRPLEELVAGHGIRVIAFVAGDVADLMQAWRAGRLDHAAYAMPGCCGRRGMRRMRRGGCAHGRHGRVAAEYDRTDRWNT